jgi:hypothetical protein
MIAVIADDITGAAEIAGIGFSYGLRVLLTRELTAGSAPRCDLLVVITNTRSASEAEAVATSTEIGSRLRAMGVDDIFKKCDSVLRGHVAAELHALIAATGKSGALLLPANPSLGRAIVEGRYFVGGKPITQTDFAHDPEYPAASDSVTDLLGEGEVISANSNIIISDGRIYIGNVAAEEVLRIYCERMPHTVLPAGGGSFFRAYLAHKHRHLVESAAFGGISAEGMLMVCGSTIRHDSLIGELSAAGVVIDEMPHGVYCGSSSPEEWTAHLCKLFGESHSLVVRIAQPIVQDAAYAVRLKQVMADVAQRVVEQGGVAHLIVEGGATAYCVIERMGWRSFEVVGQLSPGVITLRPQDPGGEMLFTLKPGSYRWPEKLINNTDTKE